MLIGCVLGILHGDGTLRRLHGRLSRALAIASVVFLGAWVAVLSSLRTYPYAYAWNSFVIALATGFIILELMGARPDSSKAQPPRMKFRTVCLHLKSRFSTVLPGVRTTSTMPERQLAFVRERAHN